MEIKIKVLILQIIAMLVFFTGCNEDKQISDKKVEKSPDTIKKQTLVQKVDSSREEMPITKKVNIKAATNEEVKINEKSESVQRKPVISKKDKELGNDTLGWYVSRNKENKTPSIRKEIFSLINKYNAIYTGDTSGKQIYLTFDEGYENGYTAKILDTLKENGVKAVFFITGDYLRKNSNLVERMISEGHIVGNHTMMHPSLPKLSDEKFEKEVGGLSKEFEKQFGRQMKLMRPPMGEFSTKVLDKLNREGYKTVFWSVSYYDYDTKKQKGAQNAFDSVIPNLHNGAIVLLHAVSKDNAEGLDRIIKEIKSRGYTLELLE